MIGWLSRLRLWNMITWPSWLYNTMPLCRLMCIDRTNLLQDTIRRIVVAFFLGMLSHAWLWIDWPIFVFVLFLRCTDGCLERWTNAQAQFMDVICINRYFGWYSDTGHSQLITFQMVREVTSWHDKHHKPGWYKYLSLGTVVASGGSAGCWYGQQLGSGSTISCLSISVIVTEYGAGSIAGLKMVKWPLVWPVVSLSVGFD